MNSQTNNKVYTAENIPSLSSMSTTRSKPIEQLDDELLLSLAPEPVSVPYSLFVKNFAQMYIDGFMNAPDNVTQAWLRLVRSPNLPVVVIDDSTHESIATFPPIGQSPIIRRFSNMLDTTNVLAEVEEKTKPLNESTREEIMVARVEKIAETMDEHKDKTVDLVDDYNSILNKAFDDLEAYANPTSEYMDDKPVEDIPESKGFDIDDFYA